MTDVFLEEVATVGKADFGYIPERVMAKDVTSTEGRVMIWVLAGTEGFILIRLVRGAVERIAPEVCTVTKSVAVVVRLRVATAASLPCPKGMGLGR